MQSSKTSQISDIKYAAVQLIREKQTRPSFPTGSTEWKQVYRHLWDSHIQKQSLKTEVKQLLWDIEFSSERQAPEIPVILTVSD